MARQGVTYSEVAEAASELLGKGKNPTIEQVRLILGTGSSTTIAAHLKTWKESQSNHRLIGARENIPDELIAMVKGLWEKIVNISDEKIKLITAQYHTSLDDLQSDLDKYRHNNQRWQHLYNNWNKEKDVLLEENKILEHGIRQHENDYTILKSQYDATINQLIDRQDRINELTNSYQHSQRTLEHTQSTAKEQRRLDQQQYQEQKEILQSKIDKLEATNYSLTTENESAREEKDKMKSEISGLTHEAAILQVKIRTHNEQITQLSKEKQEYLQAYQHWQTQCKLLENDIHHLQSAAVGQLNEISNLKQTINDAQYELQQLSGVNQCLNTEKKLLEERIKQWETKEILVPV